MSSSAALIFFRAGRGNLDTAAAWLADRGLAVERTPREFGDELNLVYPNGPRLRLAFVEEPYVREEAAEIAEGTPHAETMSQCEVRYEVLIDDLDEALDEINTLIEVQLTLQDATGGYLFNTWNGELEGPESSEAVQAEGAAPGLDPAFSAAAAYVLTKNAELYRRLA